MNLKIRKDVVWERTNDLKVLLLVINILEGNIMILKVHQTFI